MLTIGTLLDAAKGHGPDTPVRPHALCDGVDLDRAEFVGVKYEDGALLLLLDATATNESLLAIAQSVYDDSLVWHDDVELCEQVSRKYGTELTLAEAGAVARLAMEMELCAALQDDGEARYNGCIITPAHAGYTVTGHDFYDTVADAMDAIDGGEI